MKFIVFIFKYLYDWRKYVSCYFFNVLKSVSGISFMQIRNTWITVLVALTGMTILLSTVGIKVPMIQIFVTGSLRAIAYIFRGIVRLIAIIQEG